MKQKTKQKSKKAIQTKSKLSKQSAKHVQNLYSYLCATVSWSLGEVVRYSFQNTNYICLSYHLQCLNGETVSDLNTILPLLTDKLTGQLITEIRSLTNPVTTKTNQEQSGWDATIKKRCRSWDDRLMYTWEPTNIYLYILYMSAEPFSTPFPFNKQKPYSQHLLPQVPRKKKASFLFEEPLEMKMRF